MSHHMTDHDLLFGFGEAFLINSSEEAVFNESLNASPLFNVLIALDCRMP